MTFEAALARLTVDRLTALLRRRPDVLIEPAPRTIAQLAQRLCGFESLSAALEACDRDMMQVSRAIALLGPDATVPGVAALLRSEREPVTAAVDRLVAHGLAWRSAGSLAQPERMAEHLMGEITRFRPVAVVAKQALAEDVRVAVDGLGGAAGGARKTDLVLRLSELLADVDTVATALAGLSARARNRLDVLLSPGYQHIWAGGASTAQDDALTRAGLCLSVYRRAEVPREVAVAVWAAGAAAVAGPPAVPAAAPAAPDGARSAVEDALRGLTSLLDEARSGGLAMLKKGGVGSRERSRLAKRVSAAPADVGLWIDLAAAAGLLAVTDGGYAPTGEYDAWRAAEPAARWSAVAQAWWGLDFAPTDREVEEGTEVPPPVPLVSGAGMVRRALLRAAAGGGSVRAVVDTLDWYAPLAADVDGVPAPWSDAAVAEATGLGVLVGDALSELGEQLVAGGDDLARRCAALLPESGSLLVLQSDLTAMVSGQPSAAAARLLSAAAVVESRGVAATWRFTPASVRAALDAGWTAERLRDELAAISDRPLPQPLDYLIGDVARRHGSVRVRGMRCCVVGSEAEIAEILHTRALRDLHLGAVAPTVLSSPFDIDKVLARLRAAGFAPLAEDADGVVIVEERRERAAEPSTRARARPRAAAAELARKLLAAPAGVAVPDSPTYAELAALTSRLDSAELVLLAHAIDEQRDVSIVYRDRTGNRTVREIAPRELYGRWVTAWCHAKNGQRDFTVANIEAVAPAG